MEILKQRNPNEHYIFSYEKNESDGKTFMVFNNINSKDKLQKIAFMEKNNKVKLFAYIEGEWVKYKFITHFVLIGKYKSTKPERKMFRKIMIEYHKGALQRKFKLKNFY